MKARLAITTAIVTLFLLYAGNVRAEVPKWVVGGFEMSGFLSAGFGWQRFSNAPVTNNEGSSFGGPIGELIPNAQTGNPPNPGEDFIEGFLQRFELDVMKQIGKRATVRADLYFGRANSGSSVAGFALEHAYAAVRLGSDYNWEISVGRIGLVTGYESYEYYYNDTISLSILSRASLYPGPITGIQLSGDITDNIKLYVGACNGLSQDTTARLSDIPGGIAILEVDWGPEALGNYAALTGYVGPEVDGNRHLTFGVNFDMGVYFTRRLQFAMEGLYKGMRGGGGVRGNYAAGLARFHWDVTRQWAAYIKYAYGRQFEAAPAPFNLTGAEQQIHETSVGFVHELVDGVKLKLEGRVDATFPAGGKRQFVYGMAMSLDTHF